MHVNRLDRAVAVAILGTLAITGVFLAGTVSYDLDYELLAAPHASSATGTNTLCLPPEHEIGTTAASLLTSISTSIGQTPTCVLKLDRASDRHIRYPLVIEGLANTHPCSLENPPGYPPFIIGTENFDLVPGEGYRIVLDSGTSEIDYTIEGDEDPELTVTLFTVGETTPDGVSNSGFSDYCPPYNRAVDKASTLWDEIQCPLGACSRGVCTQGGQSCLASCTSCYVDANCPQGESCHSGGFCTVNSGPCPQSCVPCQSNDNCDVNETCAINFQICQGGANGGDFCNVVNSISRFVRSSGALTTYNGSGLANDFDLTSGESYRLQVKRHVAYIPGVYRGDVQVYIESQRPAPCGVQDGGLVQLLNDEDHALVDVRWHGGDTYTNLVFLPNQGPTTCGGGDSQCASACPLASSFYDDGCEYIDCGPHEGGHCGCEIIDGLSGMCLDGSSFLRCNNDADCTSAGGTICDIPGLLEPQSQRELNCNQVHCGGSPSVCGYPPLTNCCDQGFTWQNAESDCVDPTKVRCTVLGEGYQFYLERLSIDGGTNWLEASALAERGVVLDDLPVAHVNCCEFKCSGDGPTACDPCAEDSDCDPENDSYCTISPCDGRYCEGTSDPEVACNSPKDCPDHGRCLGRCG